MLIRNLKSMLLVVMLSSMTTMAFAEDAPVYDADNMPPQFDGQEGGVSGGNTGAVPSTSAPRLQVQSTSEPVYTAPSPLPIDQRLGRVEQQVNNLSTSSAKTESLQTEVQTLRGQVESLTHQVQQLQTQLRSTYADLDKRVNKMGTVAAAKPSKKADADDASKLDDADSTVSPAPVKAADKVEAAPAKAEPSQPNVAEEQQTYQTAYDLIKSKKYNDAITALQKMLQKYPSGQFAVNAHYWLGELYNLTGKNDLAATEFSVIVRDFSSSPKVPDAQLKLGAIYTNQLKWADAKAIFKKVMSKYPGTASARLASEQLKQIKQSGH